MPVREHEKKREALYQRSQYGQGGLGRWYWDYRDKVALSLIRPEDRVVLDLGCGEGITLEKIIKLYPERVIFGTDILKENLEIVKNYGLKSLGSDVYNLPLADQSVNFVLFAEVIEHLERPRMAIREIHRVLKRHGRVVAVFPNDFFFKVARLLTLKFKEAFYDPGHLQQWTPRALKKTLVSEGFEVVFCKKIPLGIWPFSLHGVLGADKKE